MPVNEEIAVKSREITRETLQKQFSLYKGKGGCGFFCSFFVDRHYSCVHDATLVQRTIAHTTYSRPGFQRPCIYIYIKTAMKTAAMNLSSPSNRNSTAKHNHSWPCYLSLALKSCFRESVSFEILARGNGTMVVFRSRWQSRPWAAAESAARVCSCRRPFSVSLCFYSVSCSDLANERRTTFYLTVVILSWERITNPPDQRRRKLSNERRAK